MGFPQIVSSYYAWSYLGLEYKLFEGDYLIDWNNTSNSAEKALLYFLSQDSFDLDLLTYTQPKEIGIGCACSPKPGHPYNYACIIAIADQAPVRDIQENKPLYQKLLDKENGEQCYELCPYVKIVPAPLQNFETTKCDYITENGTQIFRFAD